MKEYYTKDGVKLEVGMEVDTLQGKAKIVYIHSKLSSDGECIVCEIEDSILLSYEPSELISIKKYNGYGLKWKDDKWLFWEVKNANAQEFDHKRQAFCKLISHHGCRPFVHGENFLMQFNHENKEVCWTTNNLHQSSPLCYDKPYPELEETFKQFLGV